MKFPEIKMALVLTLSLGLLVIIAAGSILYVQQSASRNITSELVGRIVVRNLEVASQGIDGYLSPARKQVEFLAGLLEDGLYDLHDKVRLADLLTGSVAGTSRFGGVLFLRNDGHAVRVRRGITAARYEVTYPNLGQVAAFRAMLSEAQAKSAGYWSNLAYNPEIDTTFINYRRPLRRNGRFVGLIAAGVSIKDLSRLVSEQSAVAGNTTYLMYGENRVIAHPRLFTHPVKRSTADLAVSFERLGDEVILSLKKGVPSKLADLSNRKNVRMLELEADGVRYFVLRKTLYHYGATPFVIGIYRAAEEVDVWSPLLYTAGLIGLGILVIALVCAVLLARAIAVPIHRVRNGVTEVGRLSLADVAPIPGTWVKEVSDLARSFNTMLNGLRSFETYVPRTLVRRLIEQGTGGRVASEERELTVMFTDIADFTATCEGQTAKEVADFINAHLTLLAECVEAEGGTIDKYIGDSLMAFWGAPEPLENSAEKACRAARKIAAAIANDNKHRSAIGKTPVRVRIGVHTGPLVVGNIGAPSRVNYTVIGDTVNTAQRLESLGKEVTHRGDVIILISEATASQLPAELETKSLGTFEVKGKSKTVDVYQLNV
jgi:adenylate cyclase